MPRLPTSDSRTAVIGSSGGGKTQFAIWLLSTRDFDERPWIIFDTKGDTSLAKVKRAGAREISIYGAPPKEPGLYIVRPLAARDQAAIEKFLWLVFHNEETGLYFDEGYAVDRNSSALQAIMTQGRSKHIECITLTQRPVDCCKYIHTEASFFAIFNLTNKNDRKTMGEYLADDVRINMLPRYCCTWYDVNKQEPCQFEPVPKLKDILTIFEARLKKRKPRLI